MLDQQSELPLNEQIRTAVMNAIIAGELLPGERLPPARQLAWALRVNVHTVLKAYADLERNQVLEVRRGRGTSVKADFSIAVMERVDALKQAALHAREVGIPLARAHEIMEETWR